MEIDLATLQAMFQRAHIISELAELAGHDLSVNIDMIGHDLLHITVQDSDTWTAIAVITIPVKTRTTLDF